VWVDPANREQGRQHLTERMPHSIDRDEVRRLISEEDAQLVEVLPATDFEKEHITGAVNIPLKDLDERAPRELERERPVIVYCNDYQ
jgi:rhodanese-related sulfurtransferase